MIRTGLNVFVVIVERLDANHSNHSENTVRHPNRLMNETVWHCRAAYSDHSARVSLKTLIKTLIASHEDYRRLSGKFTNEFMVLITKTITKTIQIILIFLLNGDS